MIPVNFPEANVQFGPPPGLTEHQVAAVQAHVRQIDQGSLDGLQLVVVAWAPDAVDLERLNSGGMIYLSALGGLPPHFLTTAFAEATRPA